MRIPSGHYDRECLLALTARIPLELVRDSSTRWTRAQDECADAVWPPQMACTSGGSPTVPTRLNRRRPTRPGLSIFKRIALGWTRWCASWRN